MQNEKQKLILIKNTYANSFPFREGRDGVYYKKMKILDEGFSEITANQAEVRFAIAKKSM